MFGYVGLLNLDARDQAFWLRAARRKILFDQLRMVQAARAGGTTEEGYARIMNDIQAQIRELDGEDTARLTWEALKLKGRG